MDEIQEKNDVTGLIEKMAEDLAALRGELAATKSELADVRKGDKLSRMTLSELKDGPRVVPQFDSGSLLAMADNDIMQAARNHIKAQHELEGPKVDAATVGYYKDLYLKSLGDYVRAMRTIAKGDPAAQYDARRTKADALAEMNVCAEYINVKPILKI